MLHQGKASNCLRAKRDWVSHMKYSEETFKKWTAPLSDTEEQRTANATRMIRAAIDNSDNELKTLDYTAPITGDREIEEKRILYIKVYEDVRTLRLGVGAYIADYNAVRPHQAS